MSRSKGSLPLDDICDEFHFLRVKEGARSAQNGLLKMLTRSEGSTSMAPTRSQRENLFKKAGELGLELTEEHWSVIEFAVDYYRRNSTMCNLRTLVRESGFDKKAAYRLFPGNPIRKICSLTGLPLPPEC